MWSAVVLTREFVMVGKASSLDRPPRFQMQRVTSHCLSVCHTWRTLKNHTITTAAPYNSNNISLSLMHTYFWHIHGVEIKWSRGDREINMRKGHASIKLKFKTLSKWEEACKVPELLFIHANKTLFGDFQQSGYAHQGDYLTFKTALPLISRGGSLKQTSCLHYE